MSIVRVQAIRIRCEYHLANPDAHCPFTATHIVYIGNEYFGQYCPTHKSLVVIDLEKDSSTDKD
jgi:hypothetical protein